MELSLGPEVRVQMKKTGAGDGLFALGPPEERLVAPRRVAAAAAADKYPGIGRKRKRALQPRSKANQQRPVWDFDTAAAPARPGTAVRTADDEHRTPNSIHVCRGRRTAQWQPPISPLLPPPPAPD
jgi:hypothetical protein